MSWLQGFDGTIKQKNLSTYRAQCRKTTSYVRNFLLFLVHKDPKSSLFICSDEPKITKYLSDGGKTTYLQTVRNSWRSLHWERDCKKTSSGFVKLYSTHFEIRVDRQLSHYQGTINSAQIQMIECTKHQTIK